MALSGGLPLPVIAAPDPADLSALEALALLRARRLSARSCSPWDLSRHPGGSSRGSGAALAARFLPAATGTDTAKSLRLPAAVTGTVALKPTYGLASRHGIVPLAWSMDCAGPMARTAGDVAYLLHVIAGHDPLDPTSLPGPAAD